MPSDQLPFIEKWRSVLIVLYLGILFGVGYSIYLLLEYLGLNFKQQFFLFFGFICSYFGFTNLKKFNLIKNTPTSKILTGALKADFTEIKAIAWPLINLKSISGEPLVYYELILEEQYVKEGQETWREIGKFNSFHDLMYKINPHSEIAFLALDDSGIAQVNILVVANQFYDQIAKRNSIIINNRKDALQILESVKDIMPISTTIDLQKSKYRFVEEKILVGCPLYFLASMSSNKESSLKCYGDSKKMLHLIQENNIYKKMNSEYYTTKKILLETEDLVKECNLEEIYNVETNFVIDAFRNEFKMKDSGDKEIIFAPLLEHELLKNIDWMRSVVLCFLLGIGFFIYFLYTLQ